MSRLAVALPCVLALALVGAARDASAQSTTQVELKSPGLVLQSTDAWANWHTYWVTRSVVCASPCTAVVPSDGTYRIAGDGIPPSSLFTLPASDRVMLDVDRGSRGRHDAGALLLLVGGVTALVGAIMLAGSGSSNPAEIGGVATLATGGVMMGVGLPMLLSSATTVHFN